MMSPKLQSLEPLLRAFPKSRPPLSIDYDKIFENAYKSNREGQGIASSIAITLEKWMHRQVSKSGTFPLLELGAGTLNHVKYESTIGRYEAVEPMAVLYEDHRAARERISAIYRDIADIPYSTRYSRIVSVAVLEHVLDLPEMLARAALLLEDAGEFHAGIPSEGGLLWYLAWRLGTGIPFRLKYGLSYAPFMRSEHVNSCREIEQLIRLFFGSVKIKRFPFPGIQLSLYTVISAKNPNRDIAQEFLQLRNKFRQT